MSFIQNIITYARTGALNILNYIRSGVTGKLYGELSSEKMVDVFHATATSKVARFRSHDTKPSYKKLYNDDITYDLEREGKGKEKREKIREGKREREKIRETLNQINEEITQNKNIKFQDKIFLKKLKKIYDDEFDDEDLNTIILTLNTFMKRNTNPNPFDTKLFTKLLQFKKDAKSKIQEIGNKEYTKDLDTTQAAFIIFKENPGEYKIFFIHTRDTRIDFLKGKIPTSFLRLLYLEQFKFEGHPPPSYICVGTVDANNDKDQTQTAFHVDNFPRYFISGTLEEDFKTLYTQLFGKNAPPECGFLDFQILLDFVAATTGRDKADELFSLLPGAKGNFAPFFAYLNSLITHATPDFINLAEIEAYYQSLGQNVPPEVREFVEKYNDYLEILRENKRKFRRELLSFTPITDKNRLFTEDIIIKNLNEHLKDKSIYDPEINNEILFENDQFENDPERENIECFVFMEKTFFIQEFSNDDLNNPNLNFLIKLKDEMFEPIGERILIGRDEPSARLVRREVVDNLGSELGGSKRNKSKRRNTKKKYHFKKGRQTQRKQNNKRRSRKIR
jgi:hypothetical protein